MYDFTYHRPASLEEAERLMHANEDAVLMSGGMTLIPTLKQRLAMPSDVVDLSTIANSAISVSGGKISVGAGATHAEVAGSEAVKAAIPALAALAGHIGDPHVRHRGTLGGSIANNDPAADYPAALVALKARVETNQRSLTVEDFFTGMFETALEHGEIVTDVVFEVPKRAAYEKFPNPASRYAIAGVFVTEFDDGVRVAVTGAGPEVFRHSAMEEALNGAFEHSALDGIVVEAGGLNEDIHASAEYRGHLVGVMARRAVEAAH